MDGSSKLKAKWATKGLISACECFSCMNKINHELVGERVRILCGDPCKFKPLKGVVGSPIAKIPGMEQE